MKYFGVLGKTPGLSLAELELVKPTNIQTKGSLVIFESPLSPLEKVGDQTDSQIRNQLSRLGGLVKRGTIADESQMKEALKGTKIVGVDSNELGLMIKRNFGVRRYKILDPDRSDLEIKKKGAEVFSLGGGEYGIVQGRQNIDLYSTIDFDKPAHGMQIGMMPAKLTHILTNIGVSLVRGRKNGLSHIKKSEEDSDDSSDFITIYDPFCGFGTTNFVANHLGHHTIGSDINITPAKQNLKRWRSHEMYDSKSKITFFKHDVTTEFTKPFLDQVDVIVTEGRLGPVVKQEMLKHKNQTEKILKNNLGDIVDIYTSFLTNTKHRLPNIPIVMTVPEYLRLDHPIISDRITEAAIEIGYSVTPTGEVYQRKGQQVGRRVLVVKQSDNKKNPSH